MFEPLLTPSSSTQDQEPIDQVNKNKEPTTTPSGSSSRDSGHCTEGSSVYSVDSGFSTARQKTKMAGNSNSSASSATTQRANSVRKPRKSKTPSLKDEEDDEQARTLTPKAKEPQVNLLDDLLDESSGGTLVFSASGRDLDDLDEMDELVANEDQDLEGVFEEEEMDGVGELPSSVAFHRRISLQVKCYFFPASCVIV